MSEVIIGLNVIVLAAAIVAWFAEEPTAEELERAEFRSLSWPSKGGGDDLLG